MRFILIDRIVSMTAGQRIVAARTVRGDEDYFPDHFPGFPVVPGVLLTEMMAQTAGKCLDAEHRLRGKAMLAKILSASFRQWVRPGDEVLVHASIDSNHERYATADCYVEVDGHSVAQARLFFSFVALQSLAGDYRDHILEDFLSRQAQ